MSYLRQLVIYTFFSILVFFSVSFITVLSQINPVHYYGENETYKLDIGYPYNYYNQYFVSGMQIPLSAWEGRNLLLDMFLTWSIVCGLIFFFRYGLFRKMS